MSDNNPVAAAVNAVQNKQGEAVDSSVPNQAPAADPRNEAFERREKAIRAEKVAMQTERQKWEAKIKEYETGYVPKSKLTQDPLAVLEENGWTIDQLTESILSRPNQNDPATKAMLAKIKQLEEKQAAIERQSTENVQKQYDHAVKQINTEVKQLVDSDAAYETIKAMDMQEAVTELIKDTYANDGYLMDITEAAKQVEEHLVEQGYKMSQLGKIKSRANPAAVTAETQQKQQAPSASQPGIKTLSNNIQTAPAKRSSEKERKERAMAAFLGKLN